MKNLSLARLADHVLLSSFAEVIERDRGTSAELIQHVGEIDARRLYLPAGCSSMFDYCVRVWHMSEECAYKRIRVARAARRFPSILDALADGRLHLSAVVALAANLKRANAEELLEAAHHKTRAEVERLVAERFPRSDVPEVMRPVSQVLLPVAAWVPGTQPVGKPEAQLSPGTVLQSGMPDEPTDRGPLLASPPATTTTADSSCAPSPASPRPRTIALSPGRFALQVTVDQETYDLLQQARSLLGHSLPSGELAGVLKVALEVLVTHLQRAKCAATDSPRPRRSHANGRYVPAEVRREVWKRDGGRCTFVGDNGLRCGSSMRLELDHASPVARGGRTTVDNLRLRCRAHNQFEAERVYGAEFIRRKRGAVVVRREAPASGSRAGVTAATSP